MLWFRGSLRGYCNTKMTSRHDVHDIATIRTHARVCMIIFSHKTRCEKCNVLKITLLNHRAMYEYKLVVNDNALPFARHKAIIYTQIDLLFHGKKFQCNWNQLNQFIRISMKLVSTCPQIVHQKFFLVTFKIHYISV